MFNYFCVSYREMWASTSISPIFHLKNVSKREAAIIYLYSRRTAIVSVADKNSMWFLNLMKQNEAIKYAKYHFVFFFLLPLFLRTLHFYIAKLTFGLRSNCRHKSYSIQHALYLSYMYVYNISRINYFYLYFTKFTIYAPFSKGSLLLISLLTVKIRFYTIYILPIKF